MAQFYVAPRFIAGRTSIDIAKFRGDLLREACGLASDGDDLVLSGGDYDLDGENKGTLIFPDHCNVTTRDGQARLVSSVVGDTQGSAFEPRSGTYDNIRFLNYPWVSWEDGRTVEFYTGMERTEDGKLLVYDGDNPVVIDPPVPYAATFTNCEFYGQAWNVYDWSNIANHWTFRNCFFWAARQGLSLASNNSPGVIADVSNCLFDIDASRSVDVGETSNIDYGGVYGAMCRSGTLRITDSRMKLRGKTSVNPSYTPRCVGVYDGNDYASISDDATVIAIDRVNFDNLGQGATDTYDVFVTNTAVRASISIAHSAGSGVGGAVSKNW